MSSEEDRPVTAGWPERRLFLEAVEELAPEVLARQAGQNKKALDELLPAFREDAPDLREQLQAWAAGWNMLAEWVLTAAWYTLDRWEQAPRSRPSWFVPENVLEPDWGEETMEPDFPEDDPEPDEVESFLQELGRRIRDIEMRLVRQPVQDLAGEQKAIVDEFARRLDERLKAKRLIVRLFRKPSLVRKRLGRPPGQKSEHWRWVVHAHVLEGRLGTVAREAGEDLEKVKEAVKARVDSLGFEPLRRSPGRPRK